MEPEPDNNIVPIPNGNGGFHLLPYEVIEYILQLIPNTPEYRQRLINVCHIWRHIIRRPVWIKIEQRLGKIAGLEYDDLAWCNAFDRNLIKNHSGQENVENWKVRGEGFVFLSSDWQIIRNPTVPLDTLAEIGSVATCFGAYYPSNKIQTVNLLEEGILPIVMDLLQPKIYVSEWFGSPPGIDISYNLCVELARSNRAIIRQYHRCHREREGGKWYKAEYTFKNYGPGVRLVIFTHGGRQNTEPRVLNGCWMAKATVKVLFDFSILNEIVDDNDMLPLELETNDPEQEILFPNFLTYYYDKHSVNGYFYHPIFYQLRQD